MSLNLYNALQNVLNEAINGNAVNDVIQNRRYVEITYSDEEDNAPGPRLIQPYAYGVSKGGNEVLRAFQVQGDSLRGRPHWKTFRLDRVTSWKPRKQQFSTPPPMQGYDTEDYNENGDRSMIRVYNQVKFDNNLNDTLNAVRQQTADIKNAPKISSKTTSGPVNAWQQWKKSVYTSQPNSKKYDMYRKNIKDTENEFNRFDDDIWAKAEREREQQNNNIQNSVKMPQQNQQGPIDTNTKKDKKD